MLVYIRKRPNDGMVSKFFQGNLNLDNRCCCLIPGSSYSLCFFYGVVTIKNLETRAIFKVNGQRLKHYWGALVERDKQTINLHNI
ncbi:hypothetical protein EPI10_001559 [Gossypium australe]|uniref:Uncharacterized protein n=1 Tax=Gossypium australe TaxID=47621 RepID=A0A5B6VBF7_9ROSI|nr:hypothetical protein EPI10_001559 [Gossypium australe]